MAKDIEQAKQDLLALYASELADAKAHQPTSCEVLLREAVSMTQPLFSKSELLSSLVNQVETMVLPIRQLTAFGAWLRDSFPEADWQRYGIYLDQIPEEGLRAGDSYLFVNTGTTRLAGTLDQPVSASFAGAWTVNVRQATVQASSDAVIHLKDDVAKVFGVGAQVVPASVSEREPGVGLRAVDATPLTDQERALRDALVDRLRQSGIEVVDNVEEGQRLLDEANARSGADGTELLKDLNWDDFSDSAGRAERSSGDYATIRQQQVFHGSRADFDVFDFSHMNEGEGAQAYGWGGYVTEVEGIGKYYAQRDPNLFLLLRSRVEFDIARLKESLPFWRGYAKREGEEELKRLERELAKLDERQQAILYTVDIPDDTGQNYLSWEKPMSQRLLQRVNQWLEANGLDRIERIYSSRVDGKVTNKDLYEALGAYPRSAQQASAILYELGFVGISYPSNFRAGGTKEHHKNYVLFKEEDLKIKEKVRFFRTPSGVSYGFTVQGKVYIDPRIATAETPIHEYAHLWASAMRSANRLEWLHIVTLMKRLPLWEEIRRSYPHLKSDEELADEVLAQYSGRRGAERLRSELSKSGHAAAAIQLVKEILSRFWKGVASLIGIKFTTAEEVADRVLYDLLRGFNPYSQGQNRQPDQTKADRDDRISNGVRHQFAGERGATIADRADHSTERMDNLAVACQMEADGKPEKAIKLATGWERGADNKWRYEIGDFDKTPLEKLMHEDNQKREGLSARLKELLDRKHVLEHEVIPDFLFDGPEEILIQWLHDHAEGMRVLEGIQNEIEMLNDQLRNYNIYTDLETLLGKDSELLKYYPTLGSALVIISADMDDQVGGNCKWQGCGLITLNRDHLFEGNFLNHELQHAIQHYEGFAKGGSRTNIRSVLTDQLAELERLTEHARQMQTKQLAYDRLAVDLGSEYEKLMRDGEDWAVEKAADLYREAMNTLVNDENSLLRNGFSKEQFPAAIAAASFQREEAIEELKRLSDYYAGLVSEEERALLREADRLGDELKSNSDVDLYYALAGEVESRNVEQRLGLSPSERRATLASETEDMDRRRQIFLRDGSGLAASGRDRSVTKRSANWHRY